MKIPGLHILIGCGVLMVAVSIIFAPVCQYPFVEYDDNIYVSDNPFVCDGLTWDGVVAAFLREHNAGWYPLTMMSYLLDVEWFGINPGAHHTVNLIIHIVNSVLLFIVLTRLTGLGWRAFIVACLFAWHPLHVESVAWISSRKDVLSALFFLLMLISYERYARAPDRKRFLWVILWLGLGLMAKPILVVAPFILLLLDIWPLKRMSFPSEDTTISSRCVVWRLVREKWPLLLLALLTTALTIWAERHGGAVRNLEELPIAIRLTNALTAYIAYLSKTFWPFELAVFYPHPGTFPPVWQWVGAGALLIIITVACIKTFSTRPYLLIGWCWFLGLLLPVIGIIPIGGHFIADRFMYLPLIGLGIMVVWGIADVADVGNAPPIAIKRVVVTFIIAGLIGLGILARIQVTYWQNGVTLFRHALAVTGDNYLAHHNLGVALFHQEELDAAEIHLRKALEAQPQNALFYKNLGLVLAQQERTEDAAVCFMKAMSIRPDFVEAHYNLGVARWRQGRVEEAITCFREALRYDPNYIDAHFQLAVALSQQGDFEAAAEHFTETLRIQPDYEKTLAIFGTENPTP